MATRLEPLLFPPIRFIRPGSEAEGQPYEPSAFARKVSGPGVGIATSLFVTADNVFVAAGAGSIGRFPFRRPISKITAEKLPGAHATLDDLTATIQETGDLLLHLADPSHCEAMRAALESSPADLLPRIWLGSADLETLIETRAAGWTGRLVHTTRLSRLDRGPERHGAELSSAGIDAIEMHQTDWTGGLTTLFHRFGVACFANAVVHEREFDELFDLGIDAVESASASTMARSFATFFGDDPPPLPRPPVPATR